MQTKKILAIETSCDETALALLEARGGITNPKFKVLKNIVSSQVKIHAPFGGVVPNLAKREHLKNLPIIFKKIAGKNPKIQKTLKPDLLAVTVGPGLEPALWTGITFMEQIHKNIFPEALPVGANHLEGHLYSFLLSKKNVPLKNIFPAISLIVSGGHTILLLMKSLTDLKKLGETRDDAVGEAFDKTARLLKLPYPGGPEIQRLAAIGNPEAIKFPRPMMYDKNYDFSFSGLKTSVLYYLKNHEQTEKTEKFLADVAASFQASAIDVLTAKTLRAAKEFKTKSIMLSGGVAANQALRARFAKESKKIKMKFFAPPMEYNTDNAAMIGVAAYVQSLRRKKRSFTANGNLNL